jgi:hypothetical protein
MKQLTNCSGCHYADPDCTLSLTEWLNHIDPSWDADQTQEWLRLHLLGLVKNLQRSLEERARLVKEKTTDEYQQVAIMDVSPEAVKLCEIAIFPKTGPDALTLLASCIVVRVRYCAASHPTLPAAAFKLLAVDTNWHVRAAVARGYALPLETLNWLAENDRDSDVLRVVAANHKLVPKVMAHLINRSNDQDHRLSMMRELSLRGRDYRREVAKLLLDA